MATDLQPVRSEATSKSAFANKYEAFAEEQLSRARRRIRCLDLAAGSLGLLVLTLAYGLIMALCDRWLELASLTRQLAFAAYLLAGGVYVAFLLGGTLFRRINPYYAALRLERTLPEAKNSVVNWLDLRQQNVVPAFRSAIGYQAAKDLAKADVDQAISTRRASWLGGMAGGLFLVLVILFVFGPHQFFSLMNRAFRPFLEVTIPTRTRLSVTKPENGDVTVPLGRAVSVSVWVEGKIPNPAKPDALRLLYRYGPSDPYEERLLTRGDTEREWGALMQAAEVHNGFWYKVTGGDAETPEYRVQARSSPLLTGFDVTYQYRPYLGWKDRVTHEPNIQELRGTQVTLLTHTNRRVKEGHMALADGQAIAGELVSGDPQAVRFQWVLEKDGIYRIWFTSAEGERNVEPLPYTIKAVHDLTPQVELKKPGKDIELPANGLLSLEGTATDDFGITALRLRMKVEKGPALQPKPYRKGKSFALKDGGYPQVLEYKDFVELDKLSKESGSAQVLKDGDVLEYWVEAVDNCDYPEPNVGESKHFKVTIRPSDTNKQEQEQKRQDAGNEQKQHEKEQDKQLQEQQRKENPNQQGQPQQSPQNSNQPKSDEEKVKEQAERIQREIENQQKQNQGKSDQPKEGDPQQSKKEGDGDQQGEPKTASGEKQNQAREDSQKKPGQGGHENKQQSDTDKGDRKNEGNSGQSSDKESGGSQGQASKPDSKPQNQPNNSISQSGDKTPSGQQPGQSEQRPDDRNQKSAAGQPKESGDKGGDANAAQGDPNNKDKTQPDARAPKNQPPGQSQQGTGGQSGQKNSDQNAKPKPDEGQDGRQGNRQGNEQGGQKAKETGALRSQKNGRGNAGEAQDKPTNRQPRGDNQPLPGDPKDGTQGDDPKVRPKNDGPGDKSPGSDQTGQKPANQEKGNSDKPGDEKTENKPTAGQSSKGAEGSQDQKGAQKQQGSKGDASKGEDPKTTPEKSQGEGGERDSVDKKAVEELSKDLKSNDENKRQNALKKLQELKEKSNDSGARQAAEVALKDREGGGGAEVGQKPDGGQAKTGSSADSQKPPQDPKAGPNGSDPKGENGKNQSPSGKNDQSTSQKPGQKGESGHGQNLSSNSGESGNKPGDNNQSKNNQQTGQPPRGSQPGGSGGPGQQGGSEPSGQPSSPGDGGANRNPPTPEKGEDELSTPDNRFLQRPGDLQLEDFKKKVNKDVLKRLNMTEEEYQRFLKAYEEMLKRQPPPAVGKQDMASPVQGNRSSLPNQAVRQVESGVQSKVGNLERVGPGQPPPEYREAYKDFTRRLSEMEKTRERK